jgi:hypothetical protein
VRIPRCGGNVTSSATGIRARGRIAQQSGQRERAQSTGVIPEEYAAIRGGEIEIHGRAFGKNNASAKRR